MSINEQIDKEVYENVKSASIVRIIETRLAAGKIDKQTGLHR